MPIALPFVAAVAVPAVAVAVAVPAVPVTVAVAAVAVAVPGLRPAASPGLRPAASPGLRPVASPGLRPVALPGLRPAALRSSLVVEFAVDPAFPQFLSQADSVESVAVSFARLDLLPGVEPSYPKQGGQHWSPPYWEHKLSIQ